MTGNQCKGSRINLQEIFGGDKDSFKELLREVLQEVLEQEMTDAIGAEKGERSPGRLGYRSGYYGLFRHCAPPRYSHPYGSST
ncbi:MAG: transposase [Proteobacteria bacterium]|nr:transposase [Pseudomonadota bacterium]